MLSGEFLQVRILFFSSLFFLAFFFAKKKDRKKTEKIPKKEKRPRSKRYYRGILAKIVNSSNSFEKKSSITLDQELKDIIIDMSLIHLNISKPNSFYNRIRRLQHTSVMHKLFMLLGSICVLSLQKCEVTEPFTYIIYSYLLYSFICLIPGLISLKQRYFNVISYKPSGIGILFYVGCTVHSLQELIQSLTYFGFKLYLGWSLLIPLLN